jgi:hypothetical protein
MSTLTPDEIKIITQYLPISLKRSLNQEHKRENDQTYCQLASQIYQDDMLLVKNTFNNYVLYYYNDDYHYESYLYFNNLIYIYNIEPVDDYYVLTIKNKFIDLTNRPLIDIDLSSQYQILKHRGCEDIIKNFSKNHILNKLQNTFTTYFNPDDIKDLLYLYVFLHSNCVLLKYDEPILTTLYFKSHKLPKEEFLNDIYDLYNTLYIHFDLLKDL